MSSGMLSRGVALRDPAVADAARPAGARACPTRRSRSADAAAAPGAALADVADFHAVRRGPLNSSPHAATIAVDRLVGDAPALGERHAERVELAFDVPGTDAEDHPAARERVERRERLRRLERVAVRGDVHVGHEPVVCVVCAARIAERRRPGRTTCVDIASAGARGIAT